jgi:hypothetical protein
VNPAGKRENSRLFWITVDLNELKACSIIWLVLGKESLTVCRSLNNKFANRKVA